MVIVPRRCRSSWMRLTRSSLVRKGCVECACLLLGLQLLRFLFFKAKPFVIRVPCMFSRFVVRRNVQYRIAAKLLLAKWFVAKPILLRMLSKKWLYLSFFYQHCFNKNYTETGC